MQNYNTFQAFSILSLLLFCWFNLNGQNINPAKVILSGKLQSTSNNVDLTNKFSSYSVFKINTSSIFKSINSKTFDGRISLELDNLQSMNIVLYETNLRSNNYKAIVLTSMGKKEIPAPAISTFTGYVEGKVNLEVRLTIAEDFVYGFVEGDSDTYYIEPLSRFSNAQKNNYIVYPKSAVVSKNVTCGVNEQEAQQQFIQRSFNQDNQIHGKGLPTCKEVELAIAHDYAMYTKYNSEVQTLFAYTMGVMNNVQANYLGVFTSDIEFKIVEQVVPNCADCDPWTDSPDAGILLVDFMDWGNAANFIMPNDLAQFWTDRDFTGNTVGLAYLGAVCSNNKFHVIQDFSISADYIRVTTAHEIGHNFDSGHNATTIGNIMDPVVSNVNTWTTGSTTSVNNYLSAITCLATCSASACPPVENLSIDNLSASGIDLSWTANSAGNYSVVIKDLSTKTTVYSNVVSSNSLSFIPPIEVCSRYEVSVGSICGGTLVTLSSIIFNSLFDANIEITSLNVINCENGFYDLEVIVTHNSGPSADFNIEVGGTPYTYTYADSPQTVVISGLTADEQQNIHVQAKDTNQGVDNCIGEGYYDAPNAICSFTYIQDFNNCSLPIDWTTNNMTPSSDGVASVWEFDDATRLVSNYPAGTLDGTCMALFDDDLYLNIGGVLELVSPEFDLSNHNNLLLEFDYDFHSFEGAKSAPNDINNSSMNVEVWDGSVWNVVLTVTKPDACAFNSFWSCSPPTAAIDIDAYNNAALKVRFVYDDDGKWTGAAGIDNFKITALRTCDLPSDIQTSTSTLTADTECTDADGWTHYWNSATPEVMLLSIKKNNDPTLNVVPGDVTVGVDFSALTVLIPNSTDYVQEPSGWEVMSRYWDVFIDEAEQPTNLVSVRFYYTTTELNAILAAGVGTSNEAGLRWFKFDSQSNVDPNPFNGHTDGNSSNFILLTPTFGNYNEHRYVEFEVNGFSGGGGGSGSSILPVELGNFGGRIVRGTVELDWATFSETNSSNFVIQRSSNGDSFQPIGIRNSAGNSNNTRYYSFTDNSPRYGINYYRLKMLDKDGVSTSSKVLSFIISQDPGFVQVIPNPTNGVATVILQSSKTEEVTIQLFDTSGRNLFSTQSKLVPGDNYQSINFEQLPIGVYTVRVQSKQAFKSFKFVKI